MSSEPVWKLCRRIVEETSVIKPENVVIRCPLTSTAQHRTMIDLSMDGVEQPGPIKCEYLLTRQGVVTSLEGSCSIGLVNFSVEKK